MSPTYSTSRASQQGIVLIVAMIMLVIMSIIGISSVRGVALEERMSGASHDRSLALQAAEAALLAGETDARINRAGLNGFDPEAAPIAEAPAIVNGFAASPTTLAPDWVLGINWQVDAREANIDLGALAGTRPRYLIEYRGMSVCKSPNTGEAAADCSTAEGKLSPTCNCYLFRVTARSNPGQGRAEVILQSLFTTF